MMDETTTATSPENGNFWDLSARDLLDPITTLILAIIAWRLIDRRVRKRDAAFSAAGRLIENATTSMQSVLEIIDKSNRISREDCRSILNLLRRVSNACVGLEAIINARSFGRWNWKEDREFVVRAKASYDRVADTITGGNFPAGKNFMGPSFQISDDNVAKTKTEIASYKETLEQLNIRLLSRL